jgi:Mn2+/Fe2+ NRAMP family transporter
VSTTTAPFTPSADRRSALDRAHIGDIHGALGTVASSDTGPRLTRRRQLTTMLAILGPGLIVMAADKDAGTMSVFAQAGQERGVGMLWVLVLLAPLLYISQEMAARLGAVTGTGHARLVLERFGRLWCAFSLTDLLVLNFAILVTEFIGIALALGHFGLSRYVSVPVAGALLIGMSASGNFRRWERAMCLLIVADIGLIALAVVDHPSPATITADLVPGIGHGNGRSMLLLLIALIGTTLTPWQIFFQQSNVIDKRITPRWLAYERIDTGVGTLVFVLAAGAILVACAAAYAHADPRPGFVDAGAIARGLDVNLGRPAGAIFAIALLNASMLGAGAVSLSSSYATSEVLGVKHSLHRGITDARMFHGCFAAFIVVAAATVLIPGAPLGTITTLVQALAGILLPCTLVLLLALSNDAQLLGPLTNPRWLNALGATAVAVIIVLSTMLTLTSIFPHAGLDDALYVALGVLAAGGAVIGAAMLRTRPRATDFGELTPWERKTWTSPMLERLAAPARTPARTLGLALLRAYTVVMVVLLLARLGTLLAR